MQSVATITEAAFYTDPPDPGVVEVNLFGPGYGESIVIHLGFGRWLIVDSCAPNDEAEPSALSYLKRIGVDHRQGVKYIVATHWHDDHIRGLSQLILACPQADVFISDALRYETLMSLVLEAAPRPVTNLREMHRTVETLLERHPDVGQPYRFLVEDTAVHSELHHPEHDVEIWALSPSSTDVVQAWQAIRGLLPSDLVEISAVPKPNENHASTVLHVRVANQCVLLGADREVHTNNGRGWQSVATSATRRALRRSTLLKVPHHGSPNGDSLVIWRDLLEEDRVALLTPFRRGREGGRPRNTDVTRLCAQTPWTFSTSAPDVYSQEQSALTGTSSENNALGFEAPESARPPLSQIRARAPKNGGPWSIELVPPAAHLCKVNRCEAG
jgi:hypothetical protein